MQNQLEPKYSYFRYKGGEAADNDVRLIKQKGRVGYNTTSIHKRFEISKHNVNEDKGSFTVWIMPFEDLATVSNQAHISSIDPGYNTYAILSDHDDLKDYKNATFGLFWQSIWYPQLFVKCFKGVIYGDKNEKCAFNETVKGSKVFSAAGHFYFQKNEWFQFGVTWDKSRNILNIYVNGVQVSAANSSVNMEWEKAGDILYAGNTAFAISDLDFYSDCMDTDHFEALFKQECTCVNDTLQKKLMKTYLGIGLEKASFSPDDSWVCKLDLPLVHEKDMEAFYVQGCQDASKITEDGLHIKTNTDDNYVPRYEAEDEIMDENHVYLWTKQSFEGDLYVEFEFMPKIHNGFSLLLFQASGIQREDFMKDYKLRKTATMKMVCWENIRSYNWGYFREMDDIRDDVSSHLIMKNPWLRPLQFQCKKERIQLDRWYKLQFIQEGSHIRGIFDGDLVFDFNEDSYSNSGPSLNCGHFAIRCMLRTEMIYRNLKIYNKHTDYEVLNTEG